MENKFTLNVEKALEEKRKQQIQFYIENGRPSSVFALLIKHFEDEIKSNEQRNVH